jgi:hypothetical protein
MLQRPALSTISWGCASIGVGSAIRRAGLSPVRALERFCLSNYPTVLFVRVPKRNTICVCLRCWQLRPKQAGFRVGGSYSCKLKACKCHDPELLARNSSASVAIMAVLLAPVAAFCGPRAPWRDDAWYQRRPAGHHAPRRAGRHPQRAAMIAMLPDVHPPLQTHHQTPA